MFYDDDLDIRSIRLSIHEDDFDFNIVPSATGGLDDLDRMFMEEEEYATGEASPFDYDFIRSDSITDSFSYKPTRHSSGRQCNDGKAATITPTKDHSLDHSLLNDDATYIPLLPLSCNDRPSRRVSQSPEPDLAKLLVDHNNGTIQRGSWASTSTSSINDNNSVEYHEALKKLSDAMERTELSRRQIGMSLPSHQPGHNEIVRSQVFTSIQQQLHQQQRTATASASGRHDTTSPVIHRPCMSPVPSSPCMSMSTPSLPPQSPTHSASNEERAWIMADFFSGQRCTLTNELEHSRMQLKMYTSQLSR